MDFTVVVLVAMFLLYMYYSNDDNNKYGWVVCRCIYMPTIYNDSGHSDISAYPTHFRGIWMSKNNVIHVDFQHKKQIDIMFDELDKLAEEINELLRDIDHLNGLVLELSASYEQLIAEICKKLGITVDELLEKYKGDS